MGTPCGACCWARRKKSLFTAVSPSRWICPSHHGRRAAFFILAYELETACKNHFLSPRTNPLHPPFGCHTLYVRKRGALYVCREEAMAVTVKQARSRRLNFRATSWQERLIRLGAQQRGVNVTNFILESACLQAEQTLADKRTFELASKNWKKFIQQLEAPPQKKPALRKLFSEPSALESK